MKSFDQKVALITGAASGIGRSLAIALHQAGAHLALCDLDQAGLQGTQALAGDSNRRISLHRVDVTDLAALQQVAGQVLAEHGQVDLLINNAGITLTPTAFIEISPEQFRRVIDVNLWGVYNGTQVFLPHLVTRPEAVIVTISSLAGLVGLTGYAPYAMSKFAVRALAESLNMEYSGTNLHCMVVHPGGVKTHLIQNAPDLNEEQRAAAHQNFTRAALLSPEKAARLILRGVRSKRNRLIIGADARLVYTLRVLFPQRYPRILNAIFGRMTFK